MSDPVALTADLLRTMPLPAPEGGRGKDSRGRVLIIAGGVETPGAALLAAEAALRSGAGKLQIATVRSLAPHLAVAMPEALVAGLDETAAGGPASSCVEALRARLSRCDALLLGPGLPEDDDTAALTAGLLASVDGDGPALVLDAAALSGLMKDAPTLRRLNGRVVITPHAGEMASLLECTREAVEAEPLACARRAAELLGVVVALKGSTTHIVAPDGRSWANLEGCIGLGTSGSGDTLAGLVVGLLARGADPAQAAVWGVHVHARAGAQLAEIVGELGFLAREIPGRMPAILAELGRQES
jgi:hydroxyethylthiazole kinase-like uncharacterized protein yjeF